MSELPEKNIFMMCDEVNTSAFSSLREGFTIRNLRKNELDIWYEMPFDDDNDKVKYKSFMENYFNQVYGNKKELFFKKCLIVCNENDEIVATCFLWKAYDKISTIHWLKVLKSYENLGLGRALLSYVLKDVQKEDLPIYLHTQPESFRAIKLYTDFGFKIVTNTRIGYRQNDIENCLPYLKENMLVKDFNNLMFSTSPKEFDEAAKQAEIEEF